MGTRDVGGADASIHVMDIHVERHRDPLEVPGRAGRSGVAGT
jgi:hypothetical protein